MPHQLQSAVAAFLALVVLSGCASQPNGTGEGPANPSTIKDPKDYSYLDDPSQANVSHIHDYWGEAFEMIVFSAPVAVEGSGVGSTRASSTPFSPPDGQVVPPGARWLNITADWKNEYPSDVTFGVGWQAADGSQGYLRLPQGNTATLELTPQQADLPHSISSRWHFTTKIEFSGPGPWLAKFSAAIEIKVARPAGPLPAAPPHPDLWGVNQTRVLFSSDGPLDIRGGYEPGSQAPPASLAIELVPPHTKRMVIRMDYNSTTDPSFHFSPRLYFRGADRVHQNEKSNLEPTEAQRASANAYFEWRIDVESRMWDSPYANSTAWHVSVDWPGRLTSETNAARPVVMKGDYHVRVVVERDAIKA
jgi:hypothetical protein